MNVERLVAAYEFRATVSRRSFWFMTILFPLVILGLSFVNTLAGDLNGGSLEDALAPSGPAALGYVDEAGLIAKLPPGVPAAALVGLDTTADAGAAMESGTISGYYIVPPDYVDTGSIVFVQEEFQPLSPSASGSLIEYVLDYALTGDAGAAAALVDPTSQVEVEAASADGRGGDPTPSTYAFLVPFATLFVLFFVIVMSSSYLLQSVAGEKENHTAEVLLVSVQPRELMLGKVLGLGGVALVQIVVWVGGALLALWRVAGIPDLASVGITATFLLWLLSFLVLGYVVYGSILAALGTMVPSQREGSQLMFVVLLPLMVPLFLNFIFLEDADGSLPVALSLFPLTAPVAMTTRLAAGDVPLWQPAVALLGLAFTAYLFVLLGARVFRSGALLSSEPFSWRRAERAVRGVFGR